MEQLGSNSEHLTRPFLEWLTYIEGPNREAIMRFMANDGNFQAIMTAPGSREAHQAWEGGWMEHERQTMMIAATLYELMRHTGALDDIPEEEQFTFSDALTVLFLHDIEKPFIYGIAGDGEIIKQIDMPKPERKLFRQHVIEGCNFVITPTMANALQHVEGVRDKDYIPGERADQPLAALCHAADNMSARALYNHGRPQ